MNVVRALASGGAIGNSLIIAAGGYNGSTTVASAETENIGGGCPTPTPTPTPTCTPGGGGLVVGSTLTIGYAPNGYTQLANNIVNYTFANSQSAPNDFAVFETHDPWAVHT